MRMGLHNTNNFDVNRQPSLRVTCGFIIYLIFFFTISVAWGQKALLLQDEVYEPQIRTVLCFSGQQGLPSSVTRMETQNLLLEFDDLKEERNNYYVKLIHCNYDWTKSTLMDLDVLHDYNEFPISDYSFSINTHIPYVHYRIQVPPVKIPGNYVVTCYRIPNR